MVIPAAACLLSTVFGRWRTPVVLEPLKQAEIRRPEAGNASRIVNRGRREIPSDYPNIALMLISPDE
jgi:hypothetical protein